MSECVSVFFLLPTLNQGSKGRKNMNSNALKIQSQQIRIKSKPSPAGHLRPKIEIVDTNNVHVLKEIANFRFRIWAMELGHHSPNMDRDRRLVLDAIDHKSKIVRATVNGKTIATGRLTIVQPEEIHIFPELCLHLVNGKKSIAVASKFAVDPKFRGSKIFFKLCEALFQEGVRDGAQGFCIHSMEQMCKMYERMGFRNYMSSITIDGVFDRNGSQIEFFPMYLPASSQELRVRRSPFANLVSHTREELSPVVSNRSAAHSEECSVWNQALKYSIEQADRLASLRLPLETGASLSPAAPVPLG